MTVTKDNDDERPTQSVPPVIASSIDINAYFHEERQVSRSNCFSRSLNMPNEDQWNLIRDILVQEKKIASGNDLHSRVNDILEVLNENDIIVFQPEAISLSFQSEQEEVYFYDKVLPYIINAALRLESNPFSIPILHPNQPGNFELDDQQAESLIGAMFLSIIPEPKTGDFSGLKFYPLLFPKISFPHYLEKIRSFTSYFKFRLEFPEDKRRKIIIDRHTYSGCVSLDLKHCETFSLVTFQRNAKIEDIGDAAHVDFANKLVGGGVLSQGLAQEEILFSIYPEKIVSKLVCPSMIDEDSIIIKGTKRYTNYSGYSFGFKSLDRYVPKKSWANVTICIDAKMFPYSKHLLAQINYFDRDLMKAISGFSSGVNYSTIATGDWGCGFFGGNQKLKFLIQWLAASISKKELIYATRLGEEETNQLIEFMTNMIKLKVTPFALYSAIKNLSSVQNLNEKELLLRLTENLSGMNVNC